MGVKNIPTIRSLFSFEQFEAVLQKLAHRIAIDAITSLQGEVRVAVRNGRISEVQTDRYTVLFYANHATYEEWRRKYTDGLSFDVERKLYTTSSHCTKISYYVPSTDFSRKPQIRDKQTIEKKIIEFIDKIMAEAGIKPIPRFKLANQHSATLSFFTIDKYVIRNCAKGGENNG